LPQVVFRAAQGSNNGSTGATSISMTMPAGVVSGDVLVMAVTVRGGSNTTINTPTGWTKLGTSTVNSGTTLAQAIYWRVATAGEPGSYPVTFSPVTAVRASGAIAAVSGASTAQPASARYGGQANGSNLTITAPALGTWTAVNGMDLFFGGMAVGGNTTAPPGNYTNSASSSSGTGTGGTETGFAYRQFTTNQPTVGPVSATWSGTAGVNIGHHVYISR